MNPRIRMVLIAFFFVLLATIACGPTGSYVVLVTATPASIPTGGAEIGGGGSSEATPLSPPAAVSPDYAPTPTFIPTPNPTRTAVIDPTEEQIYIVQRGDSLSGIAQRYGVTVESLVEANSIPNENILHAGQALIIPLAIQSMGPAFKIIPDSELVYGPAAQGFDVASFLEGRDSYLAIYTEEVYGQQWSGAEIVERVALEQSINPRLLLALLEYESGWISQSTVSETAAFYPMNYRERPSQIYGLYRQLEWAGKMLMTGYYGWRQRGLSATLLADGTRVGLDPTLNAGTAGVQMLLSQTRNLDEWLAASQHTGLFATYVWLFGDPFQRAVEPLIPPDLAQPPMGFPWADDETWYYTGGPHGGWGTGSAWAALDFVPAEEMQGCDPSPSYATAVADGVIARSEWGIVVLDLDGDGFEGTGWTVFYLHISSEDRPVSEGQRVKRGDPIGKPSCEGGVSYASHLHIARRYNGEWIAADCTDCPLEVPAPQWGLDGWAVYTYGYEYDGSMVKGDEAREACTCREPFNELKHEEE
jgi:LasA protease